MCACHRFNACTYLRTHDLDCLKVMLAAAATQVSPLSSPVPKPFSVSLVQALSSYEEHEENHLVPCMRMISCNCVPCRMKPHRRNLLEASTHGAPRQFRIIPSRHRPFNCAHSVLLIVKVWTSLLKTDFCTQIVIVMSVNLDRFA